MGKHEDPRTAPDVKHAPKHAKQETTKMDLPPRSTEKQAPPAKPNR